MRLRHAVVFLLSSLRNETLPLWVVNKGETPMTVQFTAKGTYINGKFVDVKGHTSADDRREVGKQIKKVLGL